MSLLLSHEIFALVIPNLLTETECQDLIAISEQCGYEVAKITGKDGEEVVNTKVRKCGRVMIDDQNIADNLWNKIKKYVPKDFMGKSVVGLNIRSRFLKYSEGDYFKPHLDYAYTSPDGKQTTFLTVMVYLNEDYIGGETAFFTPGLIETASVKATVGSVIIFEHDVWHCGRTVEKGTKYVLRTDVLYEV